MLQGRRRVDRNATENKRVQGEQTRMGRDKSETEEMLFMGKPVAYWKALGDRADKLGVNYLLDDLIVDNAKVQYYEKMLDRIEQYRRKAG